MIEGVADAVRLLNGCFTPEDRPKGGHYMDGYRTTGFFLAWLTENKDRDFRIFFVSSTEVRWKSYLGLLKVAFNML